MLKHEAMAADEWHDNCPRGLVTVSLCIQIVIDRMQLCSLSMAYASPYHNPTATMGHSIHNVDISKSLVHTLLYMWSAVVRQVGRTAKFSKAASAYGREINIKFSGNSHLHSPSKLETSVALCCVTTLHILSDLLFSPAQGGLV